MDGGPPMGSLVDTRRRFLPDTDSYIARFVSLSPGSRDWDNYVVAKKDLDTFQPNPDQVCVPSVKSVARAMNQFRQIFSQPAHFPNKDMWTDWEAGQMLTLVAQERLHEWAVWLLTTEEAPVTVNAIVYLVLLSREIPESNPAYQRLSVFIASLARGGYIKRKDLAEALYNKKKTAWLPPVWAAKLKAKMAAKPSFADQNIPLAWLGIEALATEWLTTFETLKLWAVDSRK